MPLVNEKGGPSVSRPIPNFVLADNWESKSSRLQLQALRLCCHFDISAAHGRDFSPHDHWGAISNGLPTPAKDAGKSLASDDREVRHDR
jgi:hypothetical protein